MKKSLIAIFTLLISASSFGQNKNLDPSYSARNYKHANKVKVANRNNLDQSAVFRYMAYPGGHEYKHKHNQSMVSIRAMVRTKPVSKSKITSKHPLG